MKWNVNLEAYWAFNSFARQRIHQSCSLDMMYKPDWLHIPTKRSFIRKQTAQVMSRKNHNLRTQPTNDTKKKYEQTTHIENTPIHIHRKFHLQKLKIFR